MRAAFSGPRTIRLTRYYRGNYGGRPAYASISGGGLTKAIKIILIICAAVYVLQTLGGRAFQISLITSFGLTPAAVIGSLAVWQLVTYIFLHGGFFHILFNMFALWMFGRELESVWGTREFVKFFFVCGIGAGISSVVASPGLDDPHDRCLWIDLRHPARLRPTVSESRDASHSFYDPGESEVLRHVHRRHGLPGIILWGKRWWSGSRRPPWRHDIRLPLPQRGPLYPQIPRILRPMETREIAPKV